MDLNHCWKCCANDFKALQLEMLQCIPKEATQPSGGIESVDFVITDVKLKISLKSLVNISKSLCLKTSEQMSQQLSCHLSIPSQRGEGEETYTANSYKGYLWKKNRSLQYAHVCGFVS